MLAADGTCTRSQACRRACPTTTTGPLNLGILLAFIQPHTNHCAGAATGGSAPPTASRPCAGGEAEGSLAANDTTGRREVTGRPGEPKGGHGRG